MKPRITPVWRLRAVQFCAAFCLIGARAALVADDSPPSPATAWYTQVGTWHLIEDSLTANAHLYHDARVDGARSGAARSTVRYNRPFGALVDFSARFTPGPAPSRAGILVKNKSVAYYFLVARSAHADSLICIRRVGKADSILAEFSVGTADTVTLRIALTGHTIRLTAGTWHGAIPRPRDFPDPATIGFACFSGTVRVWDAQVKSADGVFEETFDLAKLINLRMERMFGTKKEPR